MRKKILTVFLAIIAAVNLCACGGNESTPAPAPAMDAPAEEISTEKTSDEAASAEDVYDEEYSADDLVDMWSSGSLTKEDIEYKVATGEISYEAYEEFLDLVENDQEFAIDQSDTEIIMVLYNYDTAEISVQSVNSENGEKNIISSFTVYQRATSKSDGRKWINLLSNTGCSTRAPLKRMFSEDYKYIATTRFAEDTGEYHAGYYDEEKRFHDVTVAVDAVGGDFDEPIKQISIGFTEDGYFVFAELPPKSLDTLFVGGYHAYNSDWKVYQVNLGEHGEVIESSMKPYDDLNRLQGDNWEWLEEGCEVTDWMDETRCLLNYPEETARLLYGELRIDRWNVRVFDTQTQEYSSLISGETRTNWSGVISPDGRNVAFLSAPKQGNGNASLYSVPIDGGEPVRICDDISVNRTSVNNVSSRPANYTYSSAGNSIAFLTEWINP